MNIAATSDLVYTPSVDNLPSNTFSASDNNENSTIAASTTQVESKNGPKPIFYSQLKKIAKHRKVPELREEDLEEVFVRGECCAADMRNSSNFGANQVMDLEDSQSTKPTTTSN
jgi:hypothetical protein